MIRMTEQDFDYLLNLATPMIRKEDALIRECISEFSDWSTCRQHGPCTRVPSSHGPCSRAVLRKSIARQCFFWRHGPARAVFTGVHGCPVHTARGHGPWTRHVNTGGKNTPVFTAVNTARVNRPLGLKMPSYLKRTLQDTMPCKFFTIRKQHFTRPSAAIRFRCGGSVLQIFCWLLAKGFRKSVNI